MTPARQRLAERRRFRPVVEGLEDRLTPAGHITAAIRGVDLVITGDAEANRFNVIGNTRGTIDIIPRDTDTVINNQPGMVTLLGFKGSVIINAGGGNDEVSVSFTTVNGVFWVELGDGDDQFMCMGNNVRGDALFDAGAGDDIVTIGGSHMRGTPFVNLQAGDDQISILYSKFEGGSVFAGGAGADSISSIGTKFNGAPTMLDFAQVVSNPLPRANNDAETVAKGEAVSVDVLDNDNPNEGEFDPNSVRITRGPSFGTATVTDSGAIRYQHNGSVLSKVDRFFYTVTNTDGSVSNEAMVTMTITGIGAPTVRVGATITGPTKTSPIPYVVNFSDDVTGFTASDVTLTNGTLSNFQRVSGKQYRFSVTPTADGAVSATIPAGVATNAIGLTNLASGPGTIVFDSLAPTITVNPLTTNDTTPTLTGTINDSTATVRVTVNNVTVNATVSGSAWSANFTTALAAGTYSVSATATDPAGNAATATNATGLTIDLTAPTVSVTSTVTSPTDQGSFPITIQFSKNVTGFAATDIAVTNGTITNFVAVDGDTYTATVVATSSGTVTVSVPAGAANDSAGNANTAGSLSMTVNNPAPAVVSPIANQTQAANAANTTILLPGVFTDASIGNSSVTFKITKGTTPLDLTVTLFDKAAPVTVANFFNYLDRYDDNGGIIFHRTNLEPTLKVIQGGGYTFNDATNTLSGHIPTDPPIKNEFSADRPNNRGTLAMAKTNDPNSATSEFFFNLDNANAATLGPNNSGGFTVFGETNTAGLAVLDELAAVPIKNQGGTFSQLPLVDGTTLDENNILRIPQIIVNNRDDTLSYSATSSNPGVVSATTTGFQGNQLVLDYQSAGTSTITVTAINKAGRSTSTTFTVTVT